MCKSINTVLSWPIVSMLACQSIDALSLVIITCVAIVLRFPNATELPAHPWDAALAILRSWAHYCLVPVLQAVLHELQVAGNRREEAGQSQIQHSVRRQLAVGSETHTGLPDSILFRLSGQAFDLKYLLRRAKSLPEPTFHKIR